jgi:hypothetical protein
MILNKPITFPTDFYVSKEAKDLIQSLCNPGPSHKLGKHNAQMVKDHPFFCGVKWDDVYN